LSQVVTLEIWNSTFKNIGNRLHAHGNRLLLCKTIIKLFWASGNRLLPYGNQLPESKNFGKRFFFWKNCAIQSFLWKILFILILMLFLRFLHILSLLLNLHLNLLDFFNLVWTIFGIIKIILEALLLQWSDHPEHVQTQPQRGWEITTWVPTTVPLMLTPSCLAIPQKKALGP